jgi:glycosyltransferase involved in cell wall biosynthesis
MPPKSVTSQTVRRVHKVAAPAPASYRHDPSTFRQAQGRPEPGRGTTSSGSERSALLIAYHFAPSSSVGAQRSMRFASYLPDHGWRPVVLTIRLEDLGRYGSDARPVAASTVVHRARVLKPFEVTGDWIKGLFRRRAQDETAGASTDRASAGKAAARQLSTLGRFRHWVELWMATPDNAIGWCLPAIWTGWQVVRRERPAVLYTSGPPHSAHLVGLALKWLTGLPWVADFRDPWTRRPWLASDLKRGPRYRLQQMLERLVMRHCDRLVANTEPMAVDFRDCWQLPPAKCTAITNGYDPKALPPRNLGPVPSRAPFTITHTGALYRRRDPRPLLRAIAILRDRGVIRPGDLLVNLTGHIDEQFQARDVVRDLQLDDFVSLNPPVSHAESCQALARSHVLLVIQPDTHLQVPGKLFEYVFFQRPILALTGPGATADLVRRYGLGLVVPADQAEAIADAVADLHVRFKEGSFGDRGFSRALEAFHGERLTEQLATVFNEAVMGREVDAD